MNRFALSTVATLLVVGLLFAEEKGADATKDKLQTAKEAFRTAIAKAKDKLDAGFDTEEKVLLENARLKADERIKRVEQLKEEKSLFGKDGTLPKSIEMRSLVAEYRAVATAIKATCEKSFDAAADEYLKKKDLAGAKAVVTEKATFFDEFHLPGTLPSVREFWVYATEKKDDDLWFHMQKKGEWVEHSGDNGGMYNNFKELKRTVDYIELYDAKRECGARLYNDHVDMKLKNTGWVFLSKGIWKKKEK